MTNEQREKKVAACVVVYDDEHDVHRVTSPSGNTYTIKTRTRMDECGCISFMRECSCPARKRCVHIDAVDAWVFPEDDSMEVLERCE